MTLSPTPRWSVVIPAHNCANYLALTLQSVMGQLGNRSDAEIIVVDDGSKDHPEEVVERIGGGKVRFVRSETPKGAIPNFNYCLSLANGELIHLLHGDDAVLPGFYDAMDVAFATPGVVAAFCRTQHIDGRGTPIATTRTYVPGGGIWTGALPALAACNRVATPSIVIKAETYAAVGVFDETLPHAADWDMWARVAAYGPVYFVDQVLAQYRVHAENDSSKRIRTGANMSERYAALEHVLQHMPEDQHAQLRRSAAAHAAYYAFRMAKRQLLAGNVQTAAVQASWMARSVKRVAVWPRDAA